MKTQQTLHDFEVVFFTDQDDSQQAGVLMEGDFFDRCFLADNIEYCFDHESIYFASNDKELVVKGVSEQLINQLLEKSKLHLLLVDHDILVECSPK